MKTGNYSKSNTFASSGNNCYLSNWNSNEWLVTLQDELVTNLWTWHRSIRKNMVSLCGHSYSVSILININEISRSMIGRLTTVPQWPLITGAYQQKFVPIHYSMQQACILLKVFRHFVLHQATIIEWHRGNDVTIIMLQCIICLCTYTP
jgi:hypothetical protein